MLFNFGWLFYCNLIVKIIFKSVVRIIFKIYLGLFYKLEKNLVEGCKKSL